MSCTKTGLRSKEGTEAEGRKIRRKRIRKKNRDRDFQLVDYTVETSKYGKETTSVREGRKGTACKITT